MQKILWLFLSLTVIVAARENPFETGMSPQSTTQIKDDRTNFYKCKHSPFQAVHAF